MAVWVVHAGRHGEQEDLALEQGLAVIGWGELPDLTPIKTREELDALCHQTYPEAKPRTLAAWVGEIWAFREHIHEQDLVVLPLKRRSVVAIGHVVGPYNYRHDLPPDAYHTRSVKWMHKDVPRSAFVRDRDIQLALNGLLTVYQIKQDRAEERILEVVKRNQKEHQPENTGNHEPEPPLDLEEYARDQIRTHITRAFRSHDLARLVDALLQAQGYQTQVSPPGPDGGVDIIAGRGPLGFDPPRLCVQVKSSDQPVDVRTLRELRGVMSAFGAEQGLFVSWGGFKQSVLNEARQQFFEIRLWDAGSFIAELLQHYEQLPADLQAELPLKRIWALVPEE